MKMLVNEEALTKSFRILDTEASQEQHLPFISAIEGRTPPRTCMSSMKYMLGESSGPYLSILGFDAMEGVYGSGVFKQSLAHIDAMRRNGHVVMAIALHLLLPGFTEGAGQDPHQVREHGRLRDGRRDEAAHTILLWTSQAWMTGYRLPA